MIRRALLLHRPAGGTGPGGGALSPPGAPAGAFPKPDRPVAEIVAPQWSSEAARDKAGEFDAVARGMGIAPGETVADIGAGNSYIVVRLSPAVGAGRRVLAEDVTPAYLTSLETAGGGPRQVTVVRGEPHDPRCPGFVDPRSSCDAPPDRRALGLLHNRPGDASGRPRSASSTRTTSPPTRHAAGAPAL